MRKFEKESYTWECFCEDGEGNDFRVMIPREVADNQHDFDGERFGAIDTRDGEMITVELDGDLYGLNTPGTGDMRVKQVRRFAIDYGTGAGNETVEVFSLDQAKQIADAGISYTQTSVTICDEYDNAVCRRRWWNAEFDSDVDSSEDPICYGSFGYYADWE